MQPLRAVVLLSCIVVAGPTARAQELASRPAATGATTIRAARASASQRAVPLSAPGNVAGHAKAGGISAAPSSPVGSVVTMLASLAMVLGVFLLATWLVRKSLPATGRTLPVEVVEVLGRVSLAPRQPAHLLRIGQKLLLVSISAAGTRTLTEITDPAEVDRLAGLCRQAHPQSSTAAFRQVLQHFARQPARGFLDDATVNARESADEGAAS